MVRLGKSLILVFLVGVTIYSLLSLPLLYYDVGLVKRPCVGSKEIYLYGQTLFIGDLHTTGLEVDSERFRGLTTLIKERSIVNLVILGDLFRWRSDWDSLIIQTGNEQDALRKVLEVLGLQSQRLTVYLILGNTDHDPEELNLNFEFGQTKIVSVGKCGIFHINGLTIIGLHGDQAFGGPLGFTVSIVTRNLLLEKLWKERMGIHSDVWVIMGHTHVPGIDYDARVANTGGWTEAPLKIVPRASGILIDEEGKISLITLQDDFQK
ncbi:MAG: metallophosphoesterase [Candidatus Bathyarchaeia archaeon]